MMTIKINDKGQEKEYGLTWGIAAIDRYCVAVGLEMEPALDILFQNTDVLRQTIALSKFVSCAIDSYAALNNTEGNVSYERVLNEFDNQGPALVAAVLDDFFKSKLMGQNVADVLNLTIKVVDEPAAGKKKPVKRTPAKS